MEVEPLAASPYVPHSSLSIPLRLVRRLYAGYWPHVPSDSHSRTIADCFNRVAKYVATHRASTLDWHNSHALQGDLADAIRALKRQRGAPLLTFGSAHMVRQLLAAGLVDELCLLISRHPGAGQADVWGRCARVGIYSDVLDDDARRRAYHTICTQWRGAHWNV
jgi:RibD C-terminal domain